MTLLTVFLNILVTYVPGHCLRLYPMWETRDWKTRSIIIFYLCITAFQFGGALLLQPWTSENHELYNLSVIALAVPQTIVAFFIFRRRFLQQLFLLAVSYSYHTIALGIGNFITVNWAGNAPGGIVSILATFAVAVLTLPPLLFLLRRLYSNPDVIRATPFWRLFWLLPLFFFGITMFTSSVFSVNAPETISFVVVRMFVYAAILLICVLMETAVRYVSEAETAKRKSEEAEAKSDFYHRMSHDILTPLTRVSTNVQMSVISPETASERLREAQVDVMLIAGMVNEALREDKGGGTDE